MPFHFNADGSLDLYMQRGWPGADKETNWLPCPPSGPFKVAIRVYQPEEALLNGKTKNNLEVEAGAYKIPPIKKVE